MSAPNREAVEAAALALRELNRQTCPVSTVAEAALTAALPHLFADKDAEIAALRAVAEAYNQWEADLILEGDWTNAMPRLTEPLYDRMMEIQTMRNAALAPYRARAALEMSGGVK